MSRKASERRFNPDAFVEANLWVVTRGRPYKPRFRAERAVVIVSGGGAIKTVGGSDVRSIASVGTSFGVTGETRALPSVGESHRSRREARFGFGGSGLPASASA